MNLVTMDDFARALDVHLPFKHLQDRENAVASDLFKLHWAEAAARLTAAVGKPTHVTVATTIRDDCSHWMDGDTMMIRTRIALATQTDDGLYETLVHTFKPTFPPRIRGRSPEEDAIAEAQGAQAVLDWEEGIACIHPAGAHAVVAQHAQEVTEDMSLAERRSALARLGYCSRLVSLEPLHDWLEALFARPLPPWKQNVDEQFCTRLAAARVVWGF